MLDALLITLSDEPTGIMTGCCTAISLSRSSGFEVVIVEKEERPGSRSVLPAH